MADLLKRRQERPVAHIVAPEMHRVHLASGFETTLFSRTDPEDLARLDAQSRAAIAASALAALSEPRPRGKARITLRDVAVDDSGMDKVTIVEAINDNMPFLLDSTLAEIAEHGLALRLVAHPILSVDRDASGDLRGAEGRSAWPAAAGREARELHSSASRPGRGRRAARTAGRRARAGACRGPARRLRFSLDARARLRSGAGRQDRAAAALPRRTSPRPSRSSNGCSPTTSPSSACGNIASSTTIRTAISSARTGSACCAIPISRCCARAASSSM